MIQLRRIRSYTPRGAAAPISTDSPTEPQIEVSSIHKVFSELDKILAALPESERWNIYYTLGNTDGDFKRNWHGQDVIPFDIDGIVDDAGNFDERLYLKTIFGVLGVEESKCVIVASGNGLQILVQPMHRIETKDFFRKQRDAYERICKEIAAALTAAGLQFKEVDPSSFAMNRILRLPGTENRKPDKASRWARLINGILEPQPFAISPSAPEAPGAPPDPLKVDDKSQVTEKQLTFFAIDTPAVEAGCGYLKWARENPADLNEPQWYALLSVIGRLEDGRQKAHAYSKDHPRYSERDCDRKLDQALAASGPRTCENIDSLWGGCSTCPHFKRVTSPVSIKSESFVATEKAGFYLLGRSGALQPQFEDLRRYFHREHPYKTNRKSGAVYVWDGKKYLTWEDTELRSFAHDHFNPKPAEHVASEFCSWVNRTHLVSSSWFKTSTAGYMAFANGVLDMTTGALLEHTPERGFLSCLPYSFDPDATCPAFDELMANVTCGDKQLEALLLEFIGYALVDRDYWLQKALLLIGEGSNGKSTFLRAVRMMAGEENTAGLSLLELSSETARFQLEGKLLNISDELPNYNLKSTELLKKLFGGTMTVRKLYHDGTTVENMAKFIFAGNEMPSTSDVSEGLFRRLIIVPFNAKFKVGPGDADAKDADIKIIDRIRTELPGVFNRVMGHYRNLKARGHLIEAEKAVVEHKRYREEVDRVGSWVKETLYWNGSWKETDPYIEVTSAYERYVSECKRSEEKPLPRIHWLRHLRRHIHHFDERNGRLRVGGARPRVLYGVEFRAESQKEYF